VVGEAWRWLKENWLKKRKLEKGVLKQNQTSVIRERQRPDGKRRKMPTLKVFRHWGSTTQLQRCRTHILKREGRKKNHLWGSLEKPTKKKQSTVTG